MDASTELAFAKDLVNTAMLVNQAESSELGCDHAGVEVNVVIARYLSLGPWDSALNSCFYFFGSWH
jgi:hypothetical protein